MNILFDMETSDPDDFLTLCFLACHPMVNLVGVTITPGTLEQIRLVRLVLKTLGVNIPIGASGIDKEGCVSTFHYKIFPKDSLPVEADFQAATLIYDCAKNYSDLILLTGGPLKNVHKALETYSNFTIAHWVAQGGFAGDSLVAPEHRLEKFSGRETCPTFNFNGDPKGAFLALQTRQVLKRTLVSKNVCHGTLYDEAFHQRYSIVKDKTPGSQLIYRAMEVYLKDHPRGKMLHDPLAACVVLERDVCEFTEVEVYRSKGEWGSRKVPGTQTWISVSFDKKKFEDTFMFQGC